MYPPTFDWHRMVQRPHHLLWEAARDGHVVIFCNFTQRTDRAMERVGDRFYVCHNLEMLLQADLPRPILYFNDPGHAALARRLNASRVVFDVLDDLPGWHPRWAEAAAAASDVWCASAELKHRLESIGADAVHIPNASDFGHWAALPEREPIAAAVLPHPRVAVIGRVGEWVDVPALAATARAVPEAHFLVVGPVETTEFFQADGLQNVHAVGERFYPLLPAYVHACDAALIAYHPDHPTASAADPLKLWNLLATGKPLVASGLAAADAIGAPDWCVRPEGLTDALRGVLAGEWDQRAAQERQKLAAARTWRSSWSRAALTGKEAA